jgi:hypothetical protein
MKKTIFIATMALFLSAVSYTSYAQGGGARERVDLKSQDVKSRGANAEVKAERPTTDQPAASRGSGSGTCYVYLHNYTSYSIDIYVDGYWEGTLAAYGDSYVPTGTGYTSVYGWSVGRTKEWKFSGASCNSSYDYYFY